MGLLFSLAARMQTHINIKLGKRKGVWVLLKLRDPDNRKMPQAAFGCFGFVHTQSAYPQRDALPTGGVPVPRQHESSADCLQPALGLRVASEAEQFASCSRNQGMVDRRIGFPSFGFDARVYSRWQTTTEEINLLGSVQQNARKTRARLTVTISSLASISAPCSSRVKVAVVYLKTCFDDSEEL